MYRPLLDVELFDAAITSTGEKGDYCPGSHAVIVREINAVVVETLATTTNAVLAIRKQSTAGSTATTDRTLIDTITIPGGTAAGKSYYVTGLNVHVSPGEELNVVVTTAATSTGITKCVARLDYVPDVPANFANKVLSA